MRSFRQLALYGLPLLGGVVANQGPASPSPTKSEVQNAVEAVYANANEAFQDLLNALPEESLHVALNSLNHFREGVFESNKRGVEHIHQDNPPLATKLIVAAVNDLKKRQAPTSNNGTAPTSQTEQPQSTEAPQSSDTPQSSQPPQESSQAPESSADQPQSTRAPGSSNAAPQSSAAPPESSAVVVPIAPDDVHPGQRTREQHRAADHDGRGRPAERGDELHVRRPRGTSHRRQLRGAQQHGEAESAEGCGGRIPRRGRCCARRRCACVVHMIRLWYTAIPSEGEKKEESKNTHNDITTLLMHAPYGRLYNVLHSSRHGTVLI
ncbi:uncharacterized protein CC84DRAFT_935611 [Paraphaeosphaeria sporulosa]|uniref:Uncharacterized protein n=1 Tax=Paraphaeosphaeria sporulosa TaxID=1460663 RepID=A0A177C631_9PLEO|nr:uncharacterized protein CC84DRAFT_935611 [Paraphaeosphaeria sporulosa]OAG02866.1 hypothetical protein CC84DRAFT_935611 [Paraphaeosphaeria sporulosa]